MNSDIRDIANWAISQGWRVEEDSKGYTRFFNREGTYITDYPATPSNPYRRRQSLLVHLKKAGLPWPAPSKKEQRAQRRKERMK